MPNHIYQRLHIYNCSDNETLIGHIKKQIFDEEGKLDFSKIIPQPPNIFLGCLGEEVRQMCIDEGRPTWRDWNVENWNTKWNAYGFEEKIDDSDELLFDFQTAWAIPIPIMDKIFEIARGCEIYYLAVDEGGHFAVSVHVDEGGEETEKCLKENCSALLFALRY